MKSRFCHLLGMLLLLSLTTGCATITRGTEDTLVINSEPSGADIKLSNGMTGQTPATFKLPRKDAVFVKIQKAGYQTVEVNVQPQVSGGGGAGMAGNVLLGGIIGMAVDAGSGAMNDLTPNPLDVKLVASDGEMTDVAVGGVEERLAQLRALRKSRSITESEYRRKRAEIVSKL